MAQEPKSRPYLSAGGSLAAGTAEIEAGGLTGRLLNRLFTMVGRPPVGVRLWDGNSVSGRADGSLPTLIIRDRRALIKSLLHPELFFGEAYSEGHFEVEGDLITFLEAVYRGLEQAPAPGVFRRHAIRWLSRPNRNTLDGSRGNIHRHYDIGNEFYRMWLDEHMVYTCAYFERPEATLEEAQLAKMDHVCRKLRLRPGERVVEAGCGWGALALHMARHYGVRVRAYNISHEQILYARARARAEGLDERVEFIEDDYRSIEGRFDAFVSVGMLEHVGKEHYRTLGGVIDRCLREHGRGLLHSIGRNRPSPMNAWAERHIFPGAYPPALREMMGILEPWQFSVLDVENLRLHYAETLRHWLARYEQHAAEVRAMFDEHFERAWRLYLAGSVATFTTGHLQLFQIVFARQRNNDIPLTRRHLYGAGAEQ
jgi:cyclopropane-fatty-acyl-phospholipid synthase